MDVQRGREQLGGAVHSQKHTDGGPPDSRINQFSIFQTLPIRPAPRRGLAVKQGHDVGRRRADVDEQARSGGHITAGERGQGKPVGRGGLDELVLGFIRAGKGPARGPNQDRGLIGHAKNGVEDRDHALSFRFIAIA